MMNAVQKKAFSVTMKWDNRGFLIFRLPSPACLACSPAIASSVIQAAPLMPSPSPSPWLGWVYPGWWASMTPITPDPSPATRPRRNPSPSSWQVGWLRALVADLHIWTLVSKLFDRSIQEIYCILSGFVREFQAVVVYRRGDWIEILVRLNYTLTIKNKL